jgi:co-chaperonin GroES (HSP10)
MPFMIMQHEVDPKQKLLDELGDISTFEIFNNQILVAVYIRPNKTKSGIYLSDQSREEDKVQGKVGLVVKKGPSAFVDENNEWFNGVTVDVQDWVVFRPTDGWSITVNNVLCRIIDDTAIRGKVDVPDRVW